MLFLHNGRSVKIDEQLDHLVQPRVSRQSDLDSGGARGSRDWLLSKMLTFQEWDHLMLARFLQRDDAEVGRFAMQDSAGDLSGLFCSVSTGSAGLIEESVTLAISPGVRGSKG